MHSQADGFAVAVIVYGVRPIADAAGIGEYACTALHATATA
jgi:hypothetical protein